MKIFKMAKIFIIILLCIAVLSACSQRSTVNPISKIASIPETNNLIVSYIDVGQGDSILIQLPDHKNMLIDASTRIAETKVVQYIRNSGIRTLDFVVATHPHEDHIGGMYKVVQSFGIDKFYMPKVTTNTSTFTNLIKLLNSRGQYITTAKKGQTIFNTIVSGKKLSATMLSPADSNYDDLNNYSAVVKLTYGTNSFLFDGDAGDIPESEMISSGDNLSANVLKIGHHGSSSASSPSFLDKVTPQIAVISCGKDNSYGHPHKETIDKLQARGISIYRTDINGTIIIKSDGTNISQNIPPWWKK